MWNNQKQKTKTEPNRITSNKKKKRKIAVFENPTAE